VVRGADDSECLRHTGAVERALEQRWQLGRRKRRHWAKLEGVQGVHLWLSSGRTLRLIDIYLQATSLANTTLQLRGEALSNSDLIRDTHNSFARSSPFVSDETRVATEDDDVYHFIAYTSINSTLYEIDGLQPAPIRHGDVGACPREIFADAVVPVLQSRIARYPQTEIRFNLLAMCEDLRTQAKAIGDQEMLEREERKRREWRWENALRRHNFVGFIGETMKGVTAAKVKEGTYDKWVEDAKATTQKRFDDRKRKGQGADEMDIE
jgi:ubiquitin carboxyl-terminal hydrolase L5